MTTPWRSRCHPRTRTPGRPGFEFAPGDLIYHRYLVKHRIAGGSSDVYLCLEAGAWDHVAVKIPRPHQDDRTGEEQWQIFSAEVRNWVDLQEHPNLVRCRYAGLRGRRWFLVLEWVGAPDVGRDLHAHRADLENMDPQARLMEIVRLASDICDGLTYIHDNGIVHGDLKPPNVLLEKSGRAKITDLGRASRVSGERLPGTRMSRAPTSRRVTTPEYMAPELWEGGPASVQTDIYALGCILYELAAGRRPFEAASLVEWSKRHRKQPPPRTPEVPESLGRLITDCLQKNPSRRPASASEVRGRLGPMLPPDAGPAPPAAAMQQENDQDRYVWRAGMRSLHRVSLLCAAGRAEDAIKLMTISIREEMAEELTHAGKYVSDQASPALAMSFNDRGTLVGSMDDWIRSTGDFITAIRLDPQSAVAYANLGTNYQRLNCPTIAIVAFNRAIELDPDDHRLYLKRARLLSHYGWNEAAHRDYERAVTIAPDDPDACHGMANSLAALGRDDDVLQYRAKALLPGHTPEDAPTYLQMENIRRHSEHATSASLSSFADDHDAAVAGYESALRVAPWETHNLYFLGKERLAAGDPARAIDDLRAFLARASTTHPLAPKARDLLHQAQADAHVPARQPPADPDGDPDEEVYPAVKPPGYIARNTQGQPHTLSLINLLPLKPEQRLVLLDMLYSGPASRKLKAGRLLWYAYIERSEQLRSRYGELARSLDDEAWQETASQFAAAQLATEITVRNGFGIPALLTEVQLSPNPLHDVRFSDAPAPSLGWASSGAIGVWKVIPGVQTDLMILGNPRQAPLFSADQRGYLVLDDHRFGVRYRGTEQENIGWSAEGGAVLAGCFCGGLLAIGMSSGSVAFLDPGETRDTEIIPLIEPDSGDLGEPEGQDEGLDDMRLWQSADDEVIAFTGKAFYRVWPRRDESAGPGAAELGINRPSDSARLLAACETRIVWALSGDELFVASLDKPGGDVKLAAPDASDQGFTAAAASSDGTIVAAICGSFLHVWRASEGETDYGYIAITPLAWGRCVAVSADGRYIAVGTSAGSVLIYVTRIIGEP